MLKRGENRRGPDVRFMQMSFKLIRCKSEEEEEAEEIPKQHVERKKAPVRDKTSDALEASVKFTSPTLGRSRRKQIRNQTTKLRIFNNSQMHLTKMNEQRIDEAMQTIEENPSNERVMKTMIIRGQKVNVLCTCLTFM